MNKLNITGTDWAPPERCDPEDNLRTCQTQRQWLQAMTLIGAHIGRDMRSSEMFSTGSDVVYGSDSMVIKLTHPRWAHEVENEARMLEIVGTDRQLHAPKFLCCGTLEGWPFVAMSRIPGESIADVWPKLDPEARQDLALQVGEWTHRLHQLEAPPDRETWDRWLNALIVDAAARQSGTSVPEHLLMEIDPFIESGDIPQDRTPLVYLHTEIYDAHVLLSRAPAGPWRVRGWIDFADGRLGHPFYDFPACIELMFREDWESLHAFFRGYGFTPTTLNEEFACTLLRWSLIHRFGRLTRWLEIAGDPTPKSLRELAMRVCAMGFIWK